MADTGFNWGVWTDMTISASPWTSTAGTVATGAALVGDAVSLDGVAACEVGFDLYEGNVGAISGVVTVYVLGDVDGTNYEEAIFSPWSFTVTPIQNDHVYKRFSIDPGSYGGFKLSMANACGRSLVTTVYYRTATIPAAS